MCCTKLGFHILYIQCRNVWTTKLCVCERETPCFKCNIHAVVLFKQTTNSSSFAPLSLFFIAICTLQWFSGGKIRKWNLKLDGNGFEWIHFQCTPTLTKAKQILYNKFSATKPILSNQIRVPSDANQSGFQKKPVKKVRMIPGFPLRNMNRSDQFFIWPSGTRTGLNFSILCETLWNFVLQTAFSGASRMIRSGQKRFRQFKDSKKKNKNISSFA